MLDAVSIERLAKLHPRLRVEALRLYGEASAALTGRAQVRITQTLRTFAEQQALYNIGRTDRGPAVTNARPGRSLHNYGLALDFCLIIDGRAVSWQHGTDYDGDNVADWMEVVKVFKAAGWAWGGDFRSFVDRPHLEKSFGLPWQTLLARRNAGLVDAQGYVLL